VDAFFRCSTSLEELISKSEGILSSMVTIILIVVAIILAVGFWLCAASSRERDGHESPGLNVVTGVGR
jgi:hypothetical protein